MLGVGSSFFQQFRHRFVSFLVNFLSAVESAVMAVPITPPKLVHSLRLNIRDFTKQNATQFENTETEKGPGRERRHERGKNKVTDANATTETVQLCKSFKLR